MLPDEMSVLHSLVSFGYYGEKEFARRFPGTDSEALQCMVVELCERPLPPMATSTLCVMQALLRAQPALTPPPEAADRVASPPATPPPALCASPVMLLTPEPSPPRGDPPMPVCALTAALWCHEAAPDDL